MPPKLVEKKTGTVYPLSGRVVTVGSLKDCHIRLKGKKNEQFSAHLLFSKGSYLLQKLDAEMNIEINGAALDFEKKLEHGDQICFGNQQFSFQEFDSQTVLQEIGSHIGEPVVELIGSIVSLLNDKKEDLFNDLVSSISRLLHCDAARLVGEVSEGKMKTVAKYPQNSGLDRFSNRAIDWARESGKTVLSHDEEWDDDKSQNSLERNMIASVMCAPLFINDKVLGFLYLDRLKDNLPFSEKDRVFCDLLIPLFSEILSNFQEKRRQKETIERLQKVSLGASGNIIHECNEMFEIIEMAKKQARTDSCVLVTGETGTGKELMAKLIHEHSIRAGKNYKVINCGAIPENLIESELFGHEKGAFTGASQRRAGLFESADGGTVVLDEIGELPLQLQVKLLRVLQESEIVRVGGTETKRVDVRVVAITNKDLEEEVREKRFRQDLFFRLNVLSIHLPPLRERGADVVLLSEFFNNKYSLQFGIPVKTISVTAKNTLIAHQWPGNIRELENVLQKAILLSGDTRIEKEHLVFSTIQKSVQPQSQFGTLREARNSAEKKAIVNACTKSRGNVTLAARLLDIDRKWLMKKMQEFEIRADEFRV